MPLRLKTGEQLQPRPSCKFTYLLPNLYTSYFQERMNRFWCQFAQVVHGATAWNYQLWGQKLNVKVTRCQTRLEGWRQHHTPPVAGWRQHHSPPVAVLAKTLWEAGPPSTEWGAIISSRWKNWGAWTKSQEADAPPQPRTTTVHHPLHWVLFQFILFQSSP